MNDIKNLENVFSKKRIEDVGLLLLKVSDQDISDDFILDVIATSNGYNDYSEVKTELNKLNHIKERQWTENEEDDICFSVFDNMSDKEKKEFCTLNKDKVIFTLCYYYHETNIDGYNILSKDCFTKKEVINIIEKHSGTLFDYEVCDCNGGSSFMIMIDKNQDSVNNIIIEAYKSTYEEQSYETDFPEVDKLKRPHF